MLSVKSLMNASPQCLWLFEEEQQKLKSAIPEMETYLENETDKTDNLQRFIDRVKRVTQLTELTPEIVHEFIERIIVSKPEYRGGKRYQTLEIYYNGVGIVKEPTPEEMEELFQERLESRKSTKRHSHRIHRFKEHEIYIEIQGGWGTFLTEGAPSWIALFLSSRFRPLFNFAYPSLRFYLRQPRFPRSPRLTGLKG